MSVAVRIVVGVLIVAATVAVHLYFDWKKRVEWKKREEKRRAH